MQHRIASIAMFAALLAFASLSSPAFAAPGTPFALLGAALEGQLNINTATTEQLVLLPGVGPATAAKIIEYRARHPFQKLVHLMRVKGIGRKTFDTIAPHLVVEGETTLREVPKTS